MVVSQTLEYKNYIVIKINLLQNSIKDAAE